MKKIKLLGLLLCAAAGAAQAQEVPPDGEAELRTVRVSGVRDPAMMPYEKAYELLSTVRKVGDGKVDLLIRVLSAKTLQPVSDLEITLQGDTMSEKLPLSADGFLTVPLSPERVADKATLLTNKKKGSLRGEIFFVPVLPREHLRYGDLHASIAAGTRARAELIPWYARLILPSIDKVAICYPDRQQVVSIADSGELRAARVERKSTTKQTVYCAEFSARETAAAKDLIIGAPEGWTSLF